MKLTKTIYVFILALLTSGVLEVSFLGESVRDMMLFLTLTWSAAGICLYGKRQAAFPVITALLPVCLLLNLLYSVIAQDQPVLRTLVAMRDVICFVTLVTSLVVVKPSPAQIEGAIRPLAYTAILLIPVIYFFPSLYASETAMRSFEFNQMKDGKDLIAVWPGHCCAVLYFYFQLGRMMRSSDIRDCVPSTVFLVYIVLMQNRSTMVCALPCYVIALLKSGSKYKWHLSALIALAGIPASVSIFESLFLETSEQLGNDSYSRWLALSFFLVEQPYDIWNVLFGHGVPCTGSRHLDEMLYVQDTSSVFISDIGLIGTFYFFGILFISVFYYFTIKTAFSRKAPVYLRMYAFWIIFVPIIHCIGLGALYDSFHLGVFLYLARRVDPSFVTLGFGGNRRLILRV